MNNLTVKQQKPSDKTWFDEQGNGVPFNRLTKFEKNKEATIGKLAKEALAISNKLLHFKATIKAAIEQMHLEMLADNEASPQKGKGKGNRTFYLFDRSVKVEVNINEPIRFDEEYIKLAKNELDIMLAEELGETADWLKGIITDAFEKNRGELDTDKVLSLKKHASRTTNARFHKAMGYIDKAINRPTSKAYYSVSIRNAEGKYELVQLNIAAI